jgi:Spy/CpxP family protein refolding chaperone
MKTKYIMVLGVLVLAGGALAQNPPTDPRDLPHPPKGAHGMMVRREMGKWWQNPDIVSKLQLTDAQVTQLNQVFYNHKLKLIDYGAEMEKADLKLQTLLDADQPDESQVSAQVDQVLAARGKLEREFTMMNLNLRKQLSLDQWRQLKTLRGDAGAGDHFMFFQKQLGPGGPGPGGDVIYFHKKVGPGGPGPDELPPPPPGEMQ